MGVLDEIIVGVREDLAVREASLPLRELMDAVAQLPPTLDPMPVSYTHLDVYKRQPPNKTLP